MERRRFRVFGRVQGVGFRYTSARLAARFPVTGTVQNLPDGTVQLEVQGVPQDIAAYLASVQDHFAGNITHVETVSLPILPEEAGFSIVR
uniref:acylphosphatase n=1 Tax=Schlesneria paludicola TaxID=360056 RepID=A0A7C4QHJ1_9PLAN